jgi:heterotetrameric sarcosine oxidase gamma subunit
MSLSTSSPHPVDPPVVADAESGTTDEMRRRLQTGVGLAAVNDRGLLNIRGRAAPALLQGHYGVDLHGVGVVQPVPDGVLACLRPDGFVLLTPTIHAAQAALEATAGAGLLTLTDLTHGRSFMLLAGRHATDVLAKVCALDFSDRQFPDCHAAQTVLAKVRALIIRVDAEGVPAYSLIVDRSLGPYVWGVVAAAQEFGGFTMQAAALQTSG